MIALYFALDILVTVIHDWVLTRCIVTSLCKQKKGSYAAWLPYTVSTLMTVLSTWVIQSPYLHVIIILLANILAIRLCYRDSVYKALTCAFISHAISMSIDCTLLVILDRMMEEPFIMIGGRQFGYWPVYLMGVAALLALAYIIRIALRDFQYEIAFRDFAVILVCYFPTFLLSQSNAVAFLGLDAEWFRPFEWLLAAILGVVSTLVLLCVKNQFYLRDKVIEYKVEIDRLERQYAYYQNRQAEEERIRSLYHDMKNHLLLLKGQQGKEQARTADALLSQITEYEDYQQTENPFLDVIVRDKARQAREYQADFKCNIQFEDGDFIQPLDISTIYGNALDNALEAVNKLPPEERIITVKSGRVQDSIVIVFENTSRVGTVPKSSKTDRFLHGFGIPNIRKAVEKYGGECTIQSGDGKFIMTICIPIPQSRRNLPSCPMNSSQV